MDTSNPDKPCFALELPIQATLLCVASTLSFLGATLILLSCSWLRRRQLENLLVKQLWQLGLADIALAIWEMWLCAGVASGWTEFGQCRPYLFVDRFFLILSVLFSLALAVGLVMQLLHLRIPWALHRSGILAPGAAIVLNLAYVFGYDDDDIMFDNDYGQMCLSKGLASDIFALEISIVFVGIVSLHAIVLVQVWRTLPRSVARRSVRSASRYLSAFFVTHILNVIAKGWLWLDPGISGNTACNLRFEQFRLTGGVFLGLNGFWNFLAFIGHVWNIHRRKRCVKEVTFRRSLEEAVAVTFYTNSHRTSEVGSAPPEDEELGACLVELTFGGREQQMRQTSWRSSRPSAATEGDMLDNALTQSDRLSFCSND